MELITFTNEIMLLLMMTTRKRASQFIKAALSLQLATKRCRSNSYNSGTVEGQIEGPTRALAGEREREQLVS